MNASYHHGNLRPALLARAEETLGDGGVEGLSLRQLARDLGVSHGAPSRHFPDKQALLDALAMQGFESMNTQLAAASGAATSFRERLERVARAYVSFALKHPDLLNLMYATKHHESASEKLRDTGATGMLIARNLLAEAQNAGEVIEGSPDLLAVVALAQVHGVAVLAIGGMLGDFEIGDVLDASLRHLWRGFDIRTGDRL
ncbi:MAG: TetR/AcrR family transcriptional regulator [Rhodoglobus sp.]